MHAMIASFKREGFDVRLTPESYGDFVEVIQTLDRFEFLVDYHMPKYLLVFSAKMSKTRLYHHPLCVAGHFVIQDKASCLSVEALKPPPGCCLLDACAAPGMKTCQAAALICQEGQGHIVAVEKRPDRFKKLQEVLSMYCNDVEQNMKVVHGDFLQLNPDEYSHIEYMIVDVECSGSGRHERFESVTGKRLAKLTKLQEAILMHALTFPGLKKLAYSTCSLNVEENEGVVRNVFKVKDVQSNFKLIPAVRNWPRRGLHELHDCLRVDPEFDLCTGFFVSVFKRKRDDKCRKVFKLAAAAVDENSTHPKKRRMAAKLSSATIAAEKQQIDKVQAKRQTKTAKQAGRSATDNSELATTASGNLGATAHKLGSLSLTGNQGSGNTAE
eukprot:gnl/MRDRNA2_/MRDRNA2_57672_c1_seq1.p1 gnl/MRDRNA2_/MRDRNA2_57672_c1~~gnl/MRDRNA2_/MRDRNA2_57672_c1_seq1.p1  ORF type:complete len:384 (+),score=71.26 gnl/MRDRNA2_/MRDRNA2_57672_c1_seq1:131-1282(+)